MPATALPASITLPPPTEITRSHPSARPIPVRQVGGGFPAHVEDHRADASVAQPIRQRRASPAGASQDHEGAAAEVPGQGGDLLRLAASEEDASGGSELERHASPTSGKTLSNFTLDRGTAIMSATVSAHSR